MKKLVFISMLIGISAAYSANTTSTPIWEHQFGTSKYDSPTDISIDRENNLYILSTGFSSLMMDSSTGESVNLHKYKSDGSLAIDKNMETGAMGYTSRAKIDSKNNLYVIGFTTKSLVDKNFGELDAFARKYDANGKIVWTTQFGSKKDEIVTDAYIDKNNSLYIVGYTDGDLFNKNAGGHDAFIRKYKPNGAADWNIQFGSKEDDRLNCVTVDDLGNIYIGGETGGNLIGSDSLGGNDAFIVKLKPDGTSVWIKEAGTPVNDSVLDIKIDKNHNVYVAGYVGANIDSSSDERSESQDGYLTKYNASGDSIWLKQFKKGGEDSANALAIDNENNIYVAGSTYNDLFSKNLGLSDAYIAKYKSDGTLVSGKQFGTSSDDTALRVAIDNIGNIYVAGNTSGNLSAKNKGNNDVFIRKYTPNQF